MRIDSPLFDALNRSTTKAPRFVVRIAYPVDSLYITSHSGISGVPGTVLVGALEEPSIVSQRLNPIDGRSEIGSASFSIIDLAAEFTSEIRERLQDDVGLRNRQCAFYLGYEGMAFGDFQLIGTQRVTEASYERGRYKLSCADIQRSAKKDIFTLAECQLAQSLSATDTTVYATLTTGFTRVYHGSSYSDAPNATVGYIKIRDEVIRYTGITPTSFTGCTRGALGTVAAKYDVDAATPAARREKITEHVYLELPAVKLAYAILTGTLYGDAATLPATWHLAIDPALVRLSDFLNIGPDLWDGLNGGVVIRFEHLKKTDGKKFLEEEICRLLGCFMPVYADGALGFRRATRVLSDAATVATLNESNSVQVNELVHDMDELHNVFRINWNYTGSDFTRTTSLIDVNSAAIHGQADPLDLSFKGLYGGRATDGLINQLVDALRDRYAAPPQTLSVEVLHSLNRLEVGDVVRVAYSTVRDFAGTGNSIDRSFEIQNLSVNHRTGAVSLELFGSTAPASAASPTSASTAVPDTFYRGPTQTGGAGSSLGSVLTIIGDTVAAGTYTIAGGATLTAPGSIFYWDGDLTIPQGAVVNITGNVQLRVRGYVTVNGTISGVGGGNAGTADGANTTVLAGTPGYVGNSRGRDGIEVSQKSGNPIMRTISAPMTVGKNVTFPYLEIRVENSAITGLPTDLRGTGGAPGGKVQYQTGFRAKGGAGGNGGAGLCVIARGFSTGASALIDLSGTDGIIGDYWDDEGKRWNAGGGGAGGPGAFLLLLDGANVSAPDLTNRLRCRTGIVPTALPYDGKLKYLDIAGDQRYSLDDRNYAGWPDPAVISGADLSFAAQRIQFIPAPETATGDLAATPPAVSSLTATAQDGYALVEWGLPVDPASYDAVELYASITNVRADAVKVYDGRSSDFKHITNDTTLRYYWARTRLGRVRSAWFPDTTTSTVAVAARPPTLTGYLTNEATVLAADSAGTVASFAAAGGSFKVFVGTVDVSATATYSLVSVSSVTATIVAGGAYAVTAMTADTGTAIFRATYAGISLDKVFTVSKSKAGTNGAAGADGKRGAGNYFASVGASGVAYSISAGDATTWDGGTLTNALAQEAAAFVIANSGTGYIEVRDLLTISDPGTRAAQRIFQGTRTNNAASVTAADWSSKVVQTIDGSLIVTGTLSASVITTGTLNASRINIDGVTLSNAGGLLSISSGGVSTTQLATDAVTTAKLADAALTVAKFASSIRPVEIVSALPSTGNAEGRTVYLTTDDKLYRWTGTAWTAAVAAVDVSGTLSDSQLAAISAAKITGQITSTQITDGAISTPKLAAGSVTTNALAANSVTANELAANSVYANALQANAVTANSIATNSIYTGALQANAVAAGKIAAAAVSTTELSAGAVTTAKLAVVNPGTSMLPDACFDDQAAWSPVFGGTLASFKTVTDAPAGRYVAYVPAGTSGRSIAWLPGGLGTNTLPIDRNKQYRFSFFYRVASGTSGANSYATLGERDASGTLIGYGGHNFYPFLLGATAAGAWTRFDASIGAGTAYPLQSNTRYIYPSFLLNWENAGGEVQISNVRLAERVEASLIVDGTVTAAKLEADLVLASTIRTAGSGYRVELSNAGAYPIWYGTGTKNSTNAKFYLDTAGNAFFGGDLAANSVTTNSIASGAVSNVQHSYSSGSSGYIYTGQSSDVLTVTITTSGGPVLIQASAQVYAVDSSALPTYEWEIRRGTTVLDSGLGSAQTGIVLNERANATLVDAPSAGTYVYAFRLKNNGGGGLSVSATNRALVCTELKR